MTGGSATTVSRPARTETFSLLAVAAISLAAYAYIFLPFLPKSDNFGGSDYSYFLPQLLAGYYWFLNNGPFSVPWFTPAFCAGMPYYGNMQGMYFSVPQFLTFVIGPTRALQVTFMVFAAAGMGGFYVLLRRMFGIGRWIALAGGVLFLFNAFFATRMIMAHLPFHAFMLVPLLAVCVLAAPNATGRRAYVDIWMLFGILILAYMVQTGMVHALPPSLLAIVAVILVHGYFYGLRAEPFIRLLITGFVTLLISAAKLTAGMAFLSQFPREMLPLAGFGGLWQSLAVALQSLFVSPAFGNGKAWLLNNQWYPDTKVYPAYHEYEYGVSYIPAVIILAWVMVFLVACLRRRQTAANSPSHLAIVLALGILLIIPILLNWYEPGWNGFLKSLPLLGSSSTLLRWICLYIPVLILLSMLIVDRVEGLRLAPSTMALAIVATVIVHNLGVDREYYGVRGDYDFTPVETAYADIRHGSAVPTVSRVLWPWVNDRTLVSRRDRNNGLVHGGTNAQCYEPMFGHRMEDYPYTALRKGPALQSNNGLLNIKNPACMQYPDANECRPGDHFASSDLAAARDFVNYRPFPFRFPWWQTLANWISLVSFLIVIAGIVAISARRCLVPRLQTAENRTGS